MHVVVTDVLSQLTVNTQSSNLQDLVHKFNGHSSLPIPRGFEGLRQRHLVPVAPPPQLPDLGLTVQLTGDPVLRKLADDAQAAGAPPRACSLCMFICMCMPPGSCDQCRAAPRRAVPCSPMCPVSASWSSAVLRDQRSAVLGHVHSVIPPYETAKLDGPLQWNGMRNCHRLC